MKKCSIGGQALIEGVMMKGQGAMAIAVRDELGQIRLETTRTSKKSPWWKKIPILRGVIAFFDSMISGVGTLLKSSEIFIEESEQQKATNKKESGTGWFMFFTLLISIVLAIGLFFFLPNVITDLLTGLVSNMHPFLKNLIDGIVRLGIFMLYMWGVTKVNDVKRVFMYHGAEHKTINCFEHEMELTVENVRNSSRIHDRCGTSFMFLVMFVAIVVFSFVGWHDNTLIRLLVRLALLPVVAGLSYEVLKLLAKTECVVFKPFKAPGAWLQKHMTTKEPDDKMIEVAIASFNAVLEMMNDETVAEQKFPKTMPLAQFKQKALGILLDAGVDEPSDVDWILCEVTKLKRSELADDINVTPYMQIKAENMLRQRAEGKPLQYVLGNTDFFGYEFFVDENVLIPRFETELLVDKLLGYINKNSRVLDLCCGSGAIGITIKLKKDCEVVLSDLSSGAVAVSEKNAKKLGAEVSVLNGDLFEKVEGKFDLIVSNPPYIPTQDILGLDKNVKDYEPTMALDGGTDGLDFYRAIISQAPDYLGDNGMLAFELGIGQMDDVVSLAQDGFDLVARVKDYNGIERIAIFSKKQTK
ncbi:MAG: peptide chain release factor N(5)-glutamine methyltransferase [Clostridiales bacterium]|nr:peptide chain release factor N(5)-glutamine methyltransferase [Clostridiales bacterium]